VGRLRELIGDSSPDVRQKVAQAIKSINDPASAKPLLAQLRQERIPAVKAALMAAMGPTRDVSAVPELVRLLEDTSFQVSEAAARALADLGPEIAKSPQATREVANALARTIERTNGRRGANRLRENTVAAMLPLKDPSLVRPLFSLLVDRMDNSPTVRRTAIRALGAMNATPLRNEIAQRIADTGGPLNDTEAGVRLEAAAALGLVGSAAQANALYAHMDRAREPDELVRDEAWKSLSSLLVEFAPVDLSNWAGVKFDKDPEKQATVYRILRDKLIQEGASSDLASVQENLGTLYLEKFDQPGEAIAPLQAALDFWDTKPGSRTLKIQNSLIKAHLRAKHYKEAVQFADARIKLGGNPYKIDMAQAILLEVERLRNANDAKQLEAALELLKEARSLDLGSYSQVLEEKDREIRSKIPALREWLPWSEFVA
jgi:HEAT repeat protein